MSIPMEGNEIFDFISKNDIDNVQKLLSEHKLRVDLYDEHGMTPLQHAAYKGNKQICQLLLDHGADVNSGRHEHGYSALHFAALSGKDDVCACLLSAGAKSYATNSVGRTASQMAAFVGNHKCVAVINNYIAKSEVDYYIVPRGLETTPKLDPILAEPLHTFIMQVNIHPVRVALNLLPSLISHLPSVRKVVSLLSEKQMKAGPETNEIMSFKLHYLSFIIGEVQKCKQGDKPCDLVELFVRKIHRPIHGEKYVAMFIRDCVREFPYRECMIFKQMVSSLARSDPTPGFALSVLTSAINGHRGFADDTTPCVTCGEENATKKCAKCKTTRYCDRECQRLHWFIHKKECARSGPSAQPDDGKLGNAVNGTAGEEKPVTKEDKREEKEDGVKPELKKIEGSSIEKISEQVSNLLCT
ncbi:hypothetical protein M8J76_010038 [Diaphorina citri]|nr:hypothetical protein M8J75_012446 [Diaphorina citri]KAI5719430.1 hypothetical protein M8J76_010038 [Diaphorina citri]